MYSEESILLSYTPVEAYHEVMMQRQDGVVCDAQAAIKSARIVSTILHSRCLGQPYLQMA